MSSEPIKLIPNGPARVKSGNYLIELADGTALTKEGPISLYHGGALGNKPFCDGSHRDYSFEG